jgi:hypothetical protein
LELPRSDGFVSRRPITDVENGALMLSRASDAISHRTEFD